MSTPEPPLRLAKKNWLIPCVAGNPGRAVITWPVVIGVPVPTLPIRIAPALDETYNCPPNIATSRRFATVDETVVLELPPAVAVTTPVTDPIAQIFVPSVAAERILPPLNELLPNVVYDCWAPLLSINTTARGTVAADDVATETVPAIAS